MVDIISQMRDRLMVQAHDLAGATGDQAKLKVGL